MKITTIKASLNVIMLVLGLGSVGAAFLGLVGIVPPSVFLGSQAAIFLYSFAGMMAIGLGDNGRRPGARCGA